jgi:hypothetical protein
VENTWAEIREETKLLAAPNIGGCCWRKKGEVELSGVSG